jgi:hypothetical protein
MGRITRYSFVCGLLLFLAWTLSGCYTQLASVGSDRDFARQEEYRGSDVDTTNADSSTYSDEEYEHARTNFYYDSYYPAFGFGVGFGYYSPWYWRPYWRYGYYYDPFYYYSPYAWGPYPGIYEPGWWYPHYGGSYGYGSRRYNTPRTFGNSRMIGTTRGTPSGYTTRGTRAGMNLTPGAVSRPSGTSNRPSVNGGRTRSSSPANLPPPRTSTGRRQGNRAGTPSRDGTINRGNSNRGGERYVAPPSQSRGGRGERSSGGGRSYSPPPARSSPAPAASPSPRGGSSGGGGSRDSGRRR